MSRQTCPDCGESFKSVGHHWRYSPSHRPDITSKQKEILTGLVMGDGIVHFKDRKNLPTPTWKDYEDNEGYRNCQISFNSSDTDEVLSYMDSPVPGFEYKWGK
jgi:hypothetical protein